jgi:hypothetical protein
LRARRAWWKAADAGHAQLACARIDEHRLVRRLGRHWNDPGQKHRVINRQVAYADSIRIAVDSVVPDVNVVVAIGNVAARERAQRDIVTARGNIDSRPGTQRNIKVAGSIHAG